MLVSVCIPTYQGAAYLGQAIESVLAQTMRDFELLVIDDGSTDGTDELVGRYTDPRLRYLRNPRNLGPEGNWNRCLAEAQGRYIKILPQDDVLAADCLMRQVAALEQDSNEQIALAFCARQIIDSKGRSMLRRGYGQRDGTVAAAVLRRQCMRRGTNLVGEPGGVMFRRKLAQQVGGFDGSIGYVIDLDYWFRLLESGDAWYHADILVSFRVSGLSWSAVIGWGQMSAFRHFLRKSGARGLDLLSGSAMAGLNTVLRQAVFFYGRGR